VHPLAAIAAHAIVTDMVLANALFFIMSPGPEQFLTRKTTRVNPVFEPFFERNFARE
jgi:hypothetical protein